ncbi:hypothetical protein ACFORO_12430 [Amycolatopsis halotolerans]|uniref:Uncharacterized protein n=1 Tax=Amycolatopsis halotolerans TaxID=330083 RepID=A0ABV7QFM2_9PSEU
MDETWQQIRDAARELDEITERWFQTGKNPEDALLDIRRVVREQLLPLIEEGAEDEHGLLMSGGGVHVRPDGIEHVYPLASWIENQQRNGSHVMHRRVIVVEDWSEVPRG